MDNNQLIVNKFDYFIISVFIIKNLTLYLRNYFSKKI